MKEEFIYAQMGGENLDNTIGNIIIALAVGSVVGFILVLHFLHSPLYAAGALLGVFFRGHTSCKIPALDVCGFCRG
jgi:hypothetical protein